MITNKNTEETVYVSTLNETKRSRFNSRLSFKTSGVFVRHLVKIQVNSSE